MSDIPAQHVCETPDCNKEATLQCPTCLKIGIQGSYFCSQACFKGYWKQHKVIHTLAREYHSLSSIPNHIHYSFFSWY